jgi:hypothetical protein
VDDLARNGDRYEGATAGRHVDGMNQMLEYGGGVLGRTSVASVGHNHLGLGSETFNDFVAESSSDLPPNPTFPPLARLSLPHGKNESETGYASLNNDTSYLPSPSPRLDSNYMPSYLEPHRTSAEHDFHARESSSLLV